MEDIEKFAGQHRVKTRRDDCGNIIISGRTGHIFEGFETGLGICVLQTTPTRWVNVRKKLQSVGFTIKQDGDTEGTAIFDPNNLEQSRTAIKLIRVKTRRTPSPAQLAVLARARTAQTASKTA